MLRKIVVVVLVLSAVDLFCGAAGAGVIAVKRDAGLDFTGDTYTDVRFRTPPASVLTPTVSDAYLYTANPASANCYLNYGATGPNYSNSGILVFKFDLSGLPGFGGGTVNKAQLRLHQTAGNSPGSLYRIVTHDWLEGTMNAGYPGAAGGASGRHPMGYNTGANQNANGGTTPPLSSWGPLSDSLFAPANDCDMAVGTSTGGGGWRLYDVTPIVATWASGSNNYGLCVAIGNYAYQSSEAGSTLEPVLFIDFTAAQLPELPVAEPAALGLFLLGGFPLIRRRRSA